MWVEEEEINSVNAKNKGGTECVTKPTRHFFVLRQNWTDFCNFFCPTHCVITYYIDIQPYMCRFQPGNLSRVGTVQMGCLSQGNLILGFFNV